MHAILEKIIIYCWTFIPHHNCVNVQRFCTKAEEKKIGPGEFEVFSDQNQPVPSQHYTILLPGHYLTMDKIWS